MPFAKPVMDSSESGPSRAPATAQIIAALGGCPGGVFLEGGLFCVYIATPGCFSFISDDGRLDTARIRELSHGAVSLMSRCV